MHKITRHMKNLAGLFVLFCLLVTACGKDNAESETDITKFSQEEIETLRDQKGFYVEGTTLYDANGNPFVMRGVNHAHTWYSDKLLETLDALETIGCNSVRIVLSNGEQWSKTEASSLEGIIAFCKERNLIAVLEVHDTTGSSEQSQPKAKEKQEGKGVISRGF